MLPPKGKGVAWQGCLSEDLGPVSAASTHFADVPDLDVLAALADAAALADQIWLLCMCQVNIASSLYAERDIAA